MEALLGERLGLFFEITPIPVYMFFYLHLPQVSSECGDSLVYYAPLWTVLQEVTLGVIFAS